MLPLSPFSVHPRESPDLVDDADRHVIRRLVAFVQDARTVGRTVVFLWDWDGTLRRLMSRPEDAFPDPAVLSLLATLRTISGVVSHVVTGRRRPDAFPWFGPHVTDDQGRPLGIAGIHPVHALQSWLREPGRWFDNVPFDAAMATAFLTSSLRNQLLVRVEDFDASFDRTTLQGTSLRVEEKREEGIASPLQELAIHWRPGYDRRVGTEGAAAADAWERDAVVPWQQTLQRDIDELLRITIGHDESGKAAGAFANVLQAKAGNKVLEVGLRSTKALAVGRILDHHLTAAEMATASFLTLEQRFVFSGGIANGVGEVIAGAMPETAPFAFVAFGDDKTDENTFGALLRRVPASLRRCVRVDHVTPTGTVERPDTLADERVVEPRAVRLFLAELLAALA